MVDFSSLSSFFFGDNDRQKARFAPTLDDARITGFGRTQDGLPTLSLRTPDTTVQGQVQSKVLGNLLGSVPLDAKTNPTKIVLNNNNVTTNSDGTISLDFTEFGGKKFTGSENELANIQGRELFDLVGASIFDRNSSNTLGLQDVQAKPIRNTVNNQAPIQRSNPVQLAEPVAPQQELLSLDNNIDGRISLDDLNPDAVLSLPDSMKIRLLDTILSQELSTRSNINIGN